jgi:hypothetical protein
MNARTLVADMLARAIEGWKLKGEKNRGGFIDRTKVENYDFILDEGGATEIDIKTPGIVQIPVFSREGKEFVEVRQQFILESEGDTSRYTA